MSKKQKLNNTILPLPNKPKANQKALDISKLAPVSLTPKEMKVLEFIEEFIAQSGFSPTYQEIKDHFMLASFNSVQNYLKQLTNKGYILNPTHQKRAIQVLKSSNSFIDHLSSVSTMGSPRTPLLQSKNDEILSLPLLGKVAAGIPLEAMKHDEFIEVAPSMIKKPDQSFALLVQGESMIEDGILDGDILLIEHTNSASNGDIIVATVDDESTVKRFYKRLHPTKHQIMIELRPSNSKMNSFWYDLHEVEIKGKVSGLIRRF